MSGHVFHPGHEELHGVTVVVESDTGRTWVGRYHERTDLGVVLRDAAVHDGTDSSQPRDVWIERQIKFGIRAESRHLLVPIDQAARITRLMEWKSATL
jgi:hypothetical protein